MRDEVNEKLANWLHIGANKIRKDYQVKNWNKQELRNTYSYDDTRSPVEDIDNAELNNGNDELLKAYGDNYKLLKPRNVNFKKTNNQLLRFHAGNGDYSFTRTNKNQLKSYNVGNGYYRNSHLNYNYNTFLSTRNLDRTDMIPRKYRRNRHRKQNIKNELQKSEIFNGDDESITSYKIDNKKKLEFTHLNYNYNTSIESFNLNDSTSKPHKSGNNNLKLHNSNHKNVILHRLKNSKYANDEKYKSHHLNFQNHPHRLNYENVTPRRLRYKKLRPRLSSHTFPKDYDSSHFTQYVPSQLVENINTLDRPSRSKQGLVYK